MSEDDEDLPGWLAASHQPVDPMRQLVRQTETQADVFGPLAQMRAVCARSGIEFQNDRVLGRVVGR